MWGEFWTDFKIYLYDYDGLSYEDHVWYSGLLNSFPTNRVYNDQA